jgi:hypothetical protein
MKIIGVIIYRLAISDSYPGPQSKQKMIAIATRTAEILKGTAKESINLRSEGPIQLTIRYPKGREEKTEISRIDDSLVKLLMRSGDFEVKIPVEDCFVIFRYSEKEHYGRSIESRIQAPFKESMDKYLAGFILLKDVLTSDLIFQKIRSRSQRLLRLVKKVGKTFLGDAYSEDMRQILTHQFRRDRVYINVFGYIFSIRTRWED